MIIQTLSKNIEGENKVNDRSIRKIQKDTNTFAFLITWIENI
jgi:hypothetical protein